MLKSRNASIAAAVAAEAALIQSSLLAIHEIYVCPITCETMKDPVIAVDGHTYERQAIQQWFSNGKSTSPVTNLPLRDTTLIPNIALRQTIESSAKARSTCVSRLTFFGTNESIDAGMAIKIIKSIIPDPSSKSELSQYLQLSCVSRSWHQLFKENRELAIKRYEAKLSHILTLGNLERAIELMHKGAVLENALLTNALRSMNVELIQYIYEKLGSNPEKLLQCMYRLPHTPAIPYKHGKAPSPENTVFYCSWGVLSDILADENNFEARVYISDWLWKQNGSNPNWIMSITKTAEHIIIINRKGQVVEQLSLDNKSGPSALKYRIPSYVTTCYIVQIACAVRACYDCCEFMDTQRDVFCGRTERRHGLC